jgi:hypothetical protein
MIVIWPGPTFYYRFRVFRVFFATVSILVIILLSFGEEFYMCRSLSFFSNLFVAISVFASHFGLLIPPNCSFNCLLKHSAPRRYPTTRTRRGGKLQTYNPLGNELYKFVEGEKKPDKLCYAWKEPTFVIGIATTRQH